MVNNMSGLSKVTITAIDGKKMYLKIEQIHPDAPSLAWLASQNEKNIKAILLYRILSLLEVFQQEDATIFKLYTKVFHLLTPFVEAEGESIGNLNKYTELTQYGSEILINIVDEVIVHTKIVTQDINKNWENGFLHHFNPYKPQSSKNPQPPHLKLEVQFKNDILQAELAGKTEFSAMGITCVYKNS